MKIGLLDVNVLIALLDPEHVMHDAAHRWFQKERQRGWATCPITENGCIRILSKAAYPTLGLNVAGVAAILAEFCTAKDHRFWMDCDSVLEPGRVDLSQVGPKNLTDIYLLTVAISQGGRLVTFDRGIRWESVAQARQEHLKVLEA
jgi:toxin-antitoxin system PIN domain toxin